MFKDSIATYVMSSFLILVISQSLFGCKIFNATTLLSSEQHIVDVFDEASQAVVFVENRRMHPTMGEIKYCSGSGYIVSHNGQKVIITNYHVIEYAYSVFVTVCGEEYEAEIIGAIPERDMAILKTKSLDALKEIQPLKIGKSSDLKVGQDVYVLGYPFGLPLTMTKGIVSGLNRKMDTFRQAEVDGCIQIDSAVNPGNSGGALLNSRGELVGMPTAIISRGGDFCGIAFAIPSDLIKQTMDSVMTQRQIMVKFLLILLDYPR